MTPDDRRIASWLALLTFATYAYFFAGGGWNQNAQFDLTRAIVERRTFAIDAYARNTGDVSYANGHVYANKAPGLSWVAALPYAALYALEPDPASALTFNVYVCTLLCVALPGALIPAMLFACARKRGIGAGWAAAVALFVAVGTQLLPYATIFMTAVPSAALLLFAYTSERRALAGLAAGMAVAMNYLCAPALVLLGVRRLSRRFESGDYVAALRYAAGAIVPIAALLAYQRICFGGFFTTSVAKTDPRFLAPDAPLGVLQLPSLEVLYAITFSPYRGVFFFAPLLLMALTVKPEWRIAALSAFFIAFNASFNGWEGGFGVGGRYLVPLIPLWGLMLLRARPRALVAALAAVSFAINFAATAVDPQPSATIPRPLTQYILPLLVRGHFSSRVPITPPWSAATFTGHTSVNRMTLDEAIVFAVHPPGTPASEWASFNLGEPFFGAGDPRSLIPIGLLIALGAAAVLQRARRSSAATPQDPAKT
jgi:hypothetical protein